MDGKKVWFIPDCELPDEGEGVLKGHESVIVLNTGKKTAIINVTLYFTDKEKYDKIIWEVKGESVRCFRMDNKEDMSGYNVQKNIQYAMKITSRVPIVIQYGRLDNRQVNLAYYTTLGYGK
jgi:hypothetical protein